MECLKDINPFTKRCVNVCPPNKVRITDVDKKTFKCYIKCPSGKKRDPKTMRCISSTTTKKQAKQKKDPSSCTSEQERLLNPKTNVYKCYKKCPSGSIRNMVSMRCNKIEKKKKSSAKNRKRAVKKHPQKAPSRKRSSSRKSSSSRRRSSSSSKRYNSSKNTHASVIGQGSFGCIHRPSLICDNSVRIDSYKHKVSKAADIKDAEREMEEYAIISKIDPQQKYHLGAPTLCKPNSNSQYNIKALKGCKHNTLKDFPNETVRLLIMKDGGKNIADCCKDILENASEDPAGALQETKDILNSMHTLIKGLELLSNKGILHNDLKAQNVVYDHSQKKSFFIDFGEMTEAKHYNNASRWHAHWSYPMENVFGEEDIFIYYMLKLKNKELFARVVCDKIYQRLGEPSLTVSEEDQILLSDLIYIFDIKKQITILDTFTDSFVGRQDLNWFITEYREFYVNTLNDTLNDLLESGRGSSEESICKSLFKQMRKITLQTFDIYGMSLVFWEILGTALTLQSKYPDAGNYAFVGPLRKLARSMCHPDYTQRAQIGDLNMEPTVTL